MLSSPGRRSTSTVVLVCFVVVVVSRHYSEAASEADGVAKQLSQLGRGGSQNFDDNENELIVAAKGRLSLSFPIGSKLESLIFWTKTIFRVLKKNLYSSP